MISIYNFDNFRDFIRDHFRQQPKQGRGQALRLASSLGVHSTLVSQVLRGTKTLTPEQASLAADFLGLLDNEAEYFLLLVQLDRAGHASLRKILTRRLRQLKKQSGEIAHRVRTEARLSDEQKSIFYSDWLYAAARQLTAIPGLNSPEAIARRLGASPARTREVIQFLVDQALCLQKDGSLSIGPQSTHIEASSPWVRSHHANWRQRAQENYSKDDPVKLHYTCPMTISRKDAEALRERILKFLESLDPLIEKSPSEELYCLNIDWFLG